MQYSSKLKSNLIGKEYEYKTVNLLELREELIKQESLSMFDIIKGYHGNNKIKLSYDYAPMYENEAVKNKVVEVLSKAVELQKDYMEKETCNYIQNKFESMKQKLQEKLGGSSYEKIVHIEDLLDMEQYYHMDRTPLKTIIGLDLVNELDGLHREFRSMWSIPRSIEEEGKKVAIDYINKELADYGLFTNGNNSAFTYKTLPNSIKLDKELIGDFRGYCYNREEEEIDDTLIGAARTMGFSTVNWSCEFPYIGLKKNSFSPIRSVMKELPEKDAKILFEKAIEKALAKENSVSPMCYYQELESNPITISRNTKNGKITLIDGYKRLLYMTDKNLLDRDVTIRVFEDLNDKDLLTLLFAENSWKTMRNRDEKADFHDRGFLFCLKQHFGIEYSDTLMEVLCLYDRVGFLSRYDTASKALSVTPSLGDIRDIATKNEYFANDVVVLTEFFNKVKNEKYPYEDNIRNFSAMVVVSLVGYIRRKEQGLGCNLTVGKLEEAMVVDEMKKAFHKKKYTSDTYIQNNFMDNKLSNVLFEKLKVLLEYKQELPKEDTEEMDR